MFPIKPCFTTAAVQTLSLPLLRAGHALDLEEWTQPWRAACHPCFPLGWGLRAGVRGPAGWHRQRRGGRARGT